MSLNSLYDHALRLVFEILNIVAQWTALYDAHTEITCLMLVSMTPELHRQFELHYPYDMVQELRSMFEKQAGVEKFDLIQSFHACQTREGLSQYEKGFSLRRLYPKVMMIKNGKNPEAKEIAYEKARLRTSPKLRMMPATNVRSVGQFGKGTSCVILMSCRRMEQLALPVLLGDYAPRVCNKHSQYGSNIEGCKNPSNELWCMVQVQNLSYLKGLGHVRLLYAEFFEKRSNSKIISGDGRSERTHRAPNRLCLNIEVEEHSLGDLNEPTSYKAAMLDSDSNKWIDAMNAEIQSMMDNMPSLMDTLMKTSYMVQPEACVISKAGGGVMLHSHLVWLMTFIIMVIKKYPKDMLLRLWRKYLAQNLELNAIADAGFETDRDVTKSMDRIMFSF
ncbi:hypothetical protein Tco_0516581 [Tanacetum coccineum]